MTPGVLRWILAAGALALHIILFAQPESQPWFWVTRPVAPPLTHLPGHAEPTLAASLVHQPPDGRTLIAALQPAIGADATRTQAKSLKRAAELSQNLTRLEAEALAARLAVQDHAVALMTTLGPHRLGRLEVQRATTSKAMGETWVWTDAATRTETGAQ